MSTPTNLFLNWTQVQFTPTGGSALSFNMVENVEFDPGGQLLPHSSDAARYPVALVNHMNNPKATMQSANIAKINALAPGAKGAFQAVLNDALNGDVAGSGAIRYVLNNAVVQNNPSGGHHSQYGKGSAVFLAYSSDGVTSPLSATVL
jgi:hypothetical protein